MAKPKQKVSKAVVEQQPAAVDSAHDHHHDATAKTAFGFWVYLMTDCILFATLFATYAVLQGNTYGGPSGKDLFDLPFVLVETLLLLTSSFTCGLAMLAIPRKANQRVMLWLAATFLLGAAFLGMELYEFQHLATHGHGWSTSAFLSAFFTLVGTHGLHIAIGLLWIGVLLARIYKRGISVATSRKLTLFSLYWHFLDVVWIGIFSVVYLMGAL